MSDISKKNERRFILIAVCLIISFLINGRPVLSSYALMTLEDYILRSKIIITGNVIEKGNKPIKTKESNIGWTDFYSLKIEVSEVMKGKISDKHVILIFPVTKLRPGLLIDGSLYVHTELEDMGKKRIWFLAESKVEEDCYRKVTIHSLSSYSLVNTTLGILQMNESEQVTELIKMLESDNISFVRTALDMLSRRKANAAVGPLVSMLNVKDKKTRDKVYLTLLSINDDAGNLKLIRVLENNLKSNIDLDIMSRIIENFKDRRVIPVLMDALDRPEFNIKVTAISKLGDFRATEAAERLLPFLGDSEPYVRNTTYEALGKIGDPKALPHLEDALKRVPQREKKNIKRALRKIRKKTRKDGRILSPDYISFRKVPILLISPEISILSATYL